MRIYAHDVGTTVGPFALTMIPYMELYVDDDGFLDADQLPDSVRELYDHRRNRIEPLRQWTWAVQKSLGRGSIASSNMQVESQKAA